MKLSLKNEVKSPMNRHELRIRLDKEAESRISPPNHGEWAGGGERVSCEQGGRGAVAQGKRWEEGFKEEENECTLMMKSTAMGPGSSTRRMEGRLGEWKAGK